MCDYSSFQNKKNGDAKKILLIGYVGFGFVPTQRDYLETFRIDLRIGQDMPKDFTIGSYVKFEVIDEPVSILKTGIFQVKDIVGRRILIQLYTNNADVRSLRSQQGDIAKLLELTNKRWGISTNIGSISYTPFDLFNNFSNIMNISGEINSILKTSYVGL